MLKEARDRIGLSAKSVFNTKPRFCLLLHRNGGRHGPSRREQSGFTLGSAEMLQHLRQWGGPKIHPLAGRLTLCGLSADGTKSRQDSIAFPLPVKSRLCLAHRLNQRDGRVKVTLCRSRGNHTAGGCGCVDGFDGCIHDETREASTMPTKNEPKWHTLPIKSHFVTHYFLSILPKKSLFMNKKSLCVKKEPFFG